MSFEPIGAITIIVGLFCMLFGMRSTVSAFVVFCVLGSAAAVLIGGANVQPAHLFLGFLAISTLFWRKTSTKILEGLRITEPGFWFLCLVLYGVLSSYVMPRLFANETYIFPIGVSAHPISSNGSVPLGPVSGNLTQSMYLLGDLICFIIIMTVGSTRDGIETLANALIAYTVTNIGFGILDLITTATGTQWILQFIRNAQYVLHAEETVGNMQRIIGSWPEASAFASMTLAAFGFNGVLWLCGRKPLVTGPLALVSLLFVVFSTSSTGLIGAVVVLVLLYVAAWQRCSMRWQDRFSSAIVIFGPLLIATLVLSTMVVNGISEKIYDYVDVLIFSKSETSSAIERSSWNIQAWQNFIDSWGLGVGLGTNRASSFILAVLSNVGIPGAVFYLLFLAFVFGVRRGVARSYPSDVRSAARMACLSLLIGSITSGTTVDQTLLFYVFAGVSCAMPEREKKMAGSSSIIVAGIPISSKSPQSNQIRSPPTLGQYL